MIELLQSSYFKRLQFWYHKVNWKSSTLNADNIRIFKAYNLSINFFIKPKYRGREIEN